MRRHGAADAGRPPHQMKQLERTMTEPMNGERGIPKMVDRAVFQTEIDALRVREKAHTREADAIAAARRQLPMVHEASFLHKGTPIHAPTWIA
jgi:hypothetical protein